MVSGERVAPILQRDPFIGNLWAESLKHFGRIGRKRYANGILYVSESVFRVGYGVIAICLYTIELFTEWLLNAMREKIKVPKPAI